MDRLLCTWICFPTISWGDIPEMSADQSHHPRQWRHPMLPSIKWDIVKYNVCIPLMSCSALVQLLCPVHLISCKHNWGRMLENHYSLEKKRQVPNYLSSLRGNWAKWLGITWATPPTLAQRSTLGGALHFCPSLLPPTCLPLRCAWQTGFAFEYTRLYSLRI